MIYNAFNNNFRHAFLQILQCNSSSLKKAKQRDFQNLLIKNKKINHDGQISTSRPNTPIATQDNTITVTKIVSINKTITNKILIKKSISDANIKRNYYDVI